MAAPIKNKMATFVTYSISRKSLLLGIQVGVCDTPMESSRRVECIYVLKGDKGAPLAFMAYLINKMADSVTYILKILTCLGLYGIPNQSYQKVA